MDENEIKLKFQRMPGELEPILKNKLANKISLFESNNIKNKIKNYQDPFGRKNILLKKVNIDDTFPLEIKNNRKLYSKYIA